MTLTVAKRKGADAHHIVQQVLERVEGLRGTLIPAEVETTITRDYGETASEKAGELLTHLIGAIVSVTIVIGFFLGWRGALAMGVAQAFAILPGISRSGSSITAGRMAGVKPGKAAERSSRPLRTRRPCPAPGWPSARCR